MTDFSGLPFLACYNKFLKKLPGRFDKRSIEWPFKELGLFCPPSSSCSKKTIKRSEDVCILDGWMVPSPAKCLSFILIDLGSFLIYYSVDVCFFCITWQMINSFILGAVIFRLTMAAGIKGNNTRLGV